MTAVREQRPDAQPRPQLTWVGVVAWCALGLVLAVGIMRVVADPFGVSAEGYSHDGMNGTVWTEGSAALREDPMGSKLGAVRQGSTYTNHPPLILVETAAAETVFGERTWAQRLPAWMGTLMAILLVERILRRERLDADERALGLLIGFGTPMVFAYGAMLDTPMTSLPFGTAALLVWQRERDGDAARWERPVTLALAVLAGWQAALLAGLTLLPRSGRSLRAAVGFAVGVALVVGWQFWVHGNLSELVTQFRQRSGAAEWSGSRSLAESIGFQVDRLSLLITPISVGIGVAGLWIGRRRSVVALVAGTVLLFPVVTSNAFGIHDYWMYWLALPLSLGGAFLAASGPWRGVNVQRLVLIGGVAVAALALTATSPAARAQDLGIDLLRVAATS